MQAVSGAGYPGVPSLDILGNVVPYIADEEPKIEAELARLLGVYADGRVVPAPLRAGAHANRVAVEHGHTVCMSVGFARRPSPGQVVEALAAWRGPPAVAAALARCPSAPTPPLVVFDAPDRPQPRRDLMLGGGMAVAVGRVREDAVLDVRLVAMGHNVVRGAAGGSVLNAELLLCSVAPAPAFSELFAA
jgi:aspartate-semialdehyde dehydrogenase